MPKITIRIEGPPKCGKSVVGSFIASRLKRFGAEVNHLNEKDGQTTPSTLLETKFRSNTRLHNAVSTVCRAQEPGLQVDVIEVYGDAE